MSATFPDLSSVSIAVVGDAMLDRYWFGAVDRISPEAPVPVMAVDRIEERAGGAANVAANIASIGARCALVALAGLDEGGRALAFELERAGVERKLVQDDALSTTVKLRMIAQNQQLIRADFEQAVPDMVLDRIEHVVKETLDGLDVLVVSDYGKGALARVSDLISAARERGVDVVVDPKGADFEKYRNATLITPNQKEFEAVVGHCATDAVLNERAMNLMKALELDSLMVTRSEKGISYFDATGNVQVSPARAREVYDVSGAGETVIAVVAALLASGVTGEAALTLANTAAGVVVNKLGTAAVTVDEINAALKRETSI